MILFLDLQTMVSHSFAALMGKWLYMDHAYLDAMVGQFCVRFLSFSFFSTPMRQRFEKVREKARQICYLTYVLYQKVLSIKDHVTVYFLTFV